MGVTKFLIIVGILFILIGLLWPLISKLGLGHLPGDLSYKGKNFRFYFPLATSIIVSILLSVVLSLIFWIFRK